MNSKLYTSEKEKNDIIETIGTLCSVLDPLALDTVWRCALNRAFEKFGFPPDKKDADKTRWPEIELTQEAHDHLMKVYSAIPEPVRKFLTVEDILSNSILKLAPDQLPSMEV